MENEPCWEGPPGIKGIIHRHQLPIYHVVSHGKQLNDDQIVVELLDEETAFSKIRVDGKHGTVDGTVHHVDWTEEDENAEYPPPSTLETLCTCRS